MKETFCIPEGFDIWGDDVQIDFYATKTASTGAKTEHKRIASLSWDEDALLVHVFDPDGNQTVKELPLEAYRLDRSTLQTGQ